MRTVLTREGSETQGLGAVLGGKSPNPGVSEGRSLELAESAPG